MSTITLSGDEYSELWDNSERGKQLARLVLEAFKPNSYEIDPRQFFAILRLARLLAGDAGDGHLLQWNGTGEPPIASRIITGIQNGPSDVPTVPGVYVDTSRDGTCPRFAPVPEEEPARPYICKASFGMCSHKGCAPSREGDDE